LEGGVKLKRLLLSVILVFLLSIGLISLRYGSALTQEGNPIPILTSIIKLELSNNGYEEISHPMNGNRYVSEYEQKHPYSAAKEYLKQHGWTFKEQMGSGLIFEKSEEIVVIETRQFSRHYYLWNVPEEVFN
jgi:hypothetical protein